LPPVEAGALTARFALIPRDTAAATLISGPTDFLPFLTMVFLHGGWLQLILNMWALWVLGGSVEDRLGPARYLLLYFACVIAALTHYQFNPASPVPALGASGAIGGVIGCHVRLLPFSRLIVVTPILFFPFFFDVPAIVFVGIWFLMQLKQGIGELLRPVTGPGIAWWAHVGGFLAGVFLGSLLVLPKREHRPYYADEGFLGFDPMGRT
jgi:membrane associated rhomboid family serine protease